MKKRRNKKHHHSFALAFAACCAIAFLPGLPRTAPSSTQSLDIATHKYSIDDKAEPDAPVADVAAGVDAPDCVLPEGPKPSAAPVTAMTVDGASGGYSGGAGVYIKNDTDYEVDVPALLAQKTNIRYHASEPSVLIVHTHGSEAYTPDSTNYYKPTDTDRTTDTNYNVVRVGQTIEKVLNQNGISAVHATVLNDSPSYNGSYDRTLDVIAQNMKAHPSIKFVVDVHRDAMISKTGKKYKVVADINSRSAAQLMFVAGTDAGGLTHKDWRENLAFMVKLQNSMNTKYPGIMRPINIRAARFNQHVTTGSMLLEVGTSGNSLDEALYSAELFAGVLAQTLKPLQK